MAKSGRAKFYPAFSFGGWIGIKPMSIPCHGSMFSLHHPPILKIGVPGGIRTHQVRFRRPAVYPVSLPGHIILTKFEKLFFRVIPFHHIGHLVPMPGIEPGTRSYNECKPFGSVQYF